jgi:hypothetical protein
MRLCKTRAPSERSTNRPKSSELVNQNLKKLQIANQRLFEHFMGFEQSYFDSSQERFKSLNPWLSNLIKTNGTYHSYISKVYEQLAERSETLSQTHEFNAYKSKLFDFSKIDSFEQIILNFEAANSNGAQIKNTQAPPVPQPKPEVKAIVNPKNPFTNKSYQNFDRGNDPFSEPVVDNKNAQGEKIDMKSSMVNDKGQKPFAEMLPMNQTSSNQKRPSQDDDFLTFEGKSVKKPSQQMPTIQPNIAPFVPPNFQQQPNMSNVPPNFQQQPNMANIPPANLVKPPSNPLPNSNGIVTQNRNVNMFGMPKSNPNTKKPPLNPLNFKNIDGNPTPTSNITQSQQPTNPFGPPDKASMYFGQFHQGNSAPSQKDSRQPENTWTPNPKSQTFSQIKDFTPRSSSKDEILQLNFDPSK